VLFMGVVQPAASFRRAASHACGDYGPAELWDNRGRVWRGLVQSVADRLWQTVCIRLQKVV